MKNIRITYRTPPPDEIQQMRDALRRQGYRPKGFTLLLPGERPPSIRQRIDDILAESDRQMRRFWDDYERRYGR
jgi:hypothetical protein